jgi:hypothetical protein
MRFVPFCLILLTTLIIAPIVQATDNIWSSLGPEGGDVSALVVNPQNPSTVYAGTYNAGAFRSVNGGGYTTSLVLLNTSNWTQTGTLQIRDKDGNPLVVNRVGGGGGSTFRYSIQPEGVFRFQTDGGSASLKSGWVRLAPDVSTSTPAGSGVFGFNPESVLVSESGIPSVIPTTHARIYVDLSGNHNTGLAITNTALSSSGITIRAFLEDGVTEAGVSQGPFELPGRGYAARFADQFISGLPAGFTGVLDIRAPVPFAALTLRSLVNERDDFLMTTFPVADANQPPPAPILFPHIAAGGGYETQFILLNPGGEASVVLRLYDESGAPMAIDD